MVNTFLTTDLVAREALMLLRRNLVAAQLFDRKYQASFTGEEKVGDTIRIRRRDEGTVQEFSTTITKDQIDETRINLTLEKHFDASFEVTSKELTLSIQDFSAQLLAPRMIRIAEAIDAYALGKFVNIPNVAKPSDTAPGALPNSIGTLAQVDQTLNELLVPVTGRVQVISPEYKATLMGVDSFVEADKRGDGGTAMENASLGHIMGFDHFMAQNVPTTSFTSGTQTSAAVNGALLPGATSIVYDGGAVAAGTMVAGDILTIAGYGNVVVAALSTASSGAGTVTIVEPLRVAVADDSAITVYDGGGNVRQIHGAAFNPSAFAFVSVPLIIPPEAPSASMQAFEGLALRVVRDYDISTKKTVMSIDALVGAAVVDGRLAAQIVKNI